MQAAGGNAQITLSWTPPSFNGGSSITGYKIYRSTNSGTETLLTTIGNVTSYTDTGLTNGVTYFYKVTATNSVGESVPSNEASATTPAVTIRAVATTLSINPISNVPWGKTITISGKLTNSSGAGLAGKTITFSGTGAVNLPNAVTDSTGSYSSSGAAPNTVTNGLTVQAHFAGNPKYAGSDSAAKTYNTLIHSTVFWSLHVPSSVPHASKYSIDGKLKDTTTGLFLASKTNI